MVIFPHELRELNLGAMGEWINEKEVLEASREILVRPQVGVERCLRSLTRSWLGLGEEQWMKREETWSSSPASVSGEFLKVKGWRYFGFSPN